MRAQARARTAAGGERSDLRLGMAEQEPEQLAPRVPARSRNRDPLFFYRGFIQATNATRRGGGYTAMIASRQLNPPTAPPRRCRPRTGHAAVVGAAGGGRGDRCSGVFTVDRPRKRTRQRSPTTNATKRRSPSMAIKPAARLAAARTAARPGTARTATPLIRAAAAARGQGDCWDGCLHCRSTSSERTQTATSSTQRTETAITAVEHRRPGCSTAHVIQGGRAHRARRLSAAADAQVDRRSVRKSCFMCRLATPAPAQRRAAANRSAATATAASRAALASSLVSVRSGARKRSVNASDRLPSPTCSPV